MYMVLQFRWRKDLSLENSAYSYWCMFLTGFTLLSVFFFLYQSPSLSWCTVFNFISSNIDENLLINLTSKVFFFGDFNTHQKDWLTYSGGTDRQCELCCNFLSHMTLLRWLIFLLRSMSPALLDFFLSSDIRCFLHW